MSAGRGARGQVNVAIGVADIRPLRDYRGQRDTHDRVLRVSVLAVADEIGSAAELVRKKVRVLRDVARGLSSSSALQPRGVEAAVVHMATLSEADLLPRDPPAPDCTPIDPYDAEGSVESFVTVPDAEKRLHVRYYRRERDRAVVGHAWFGPAAAGPPELAHGGSIATVLDDAMSAAAWVAGYTTLTARLTVDFRQGVPTGTVATFEAWITGVERRKIFTRGRLLAADGRVLAEAEAVMVVPAPGASAPPEVTGRPPGPLG